jgi:hypothetical protein
MPEDAVRNELFMAGILFHLTARAVTGILWAEQLRQIPFSVPREALKIA